MTAESISIGRTPTHWSARRYGREASWATTWTWDLKDNLNVLVSKNIEYYFKVFAKASGYGKGTQISDDNNRLNQFGFPRSVDVNRDPTSPYFGRIYVNEGLGDLQRSLAVLSRWEYMPSTRTQPTQSDRATRQNPETLPGRVRVQARSRSRWDRKVAGDISDWADTHSLVRVAPGDLSGDWPALLDPADITGQNGVWEALPRSTAAYPAPWLGEGPEPLCSTLLTRT